MSNILFLNEMFGIFLAYFKCSMKNNPPGGLWTVFEESTLFIIEKISYFLTIRSSGEGKSL